MKAGILRTIVVAAFLAALAACEKEPDGPDEPDLPPQATLRILTESVTMTPGGDTYVEFRISPFETQFNYDIGSGKCAITLTDRGGNEPKEVKIYKIEPTSDNPSDQGKYKVFLEDALVKVSFEQIFRISYRDPFGRVSTSGDFKVTCQCDELSRSLLATGLTLVNITTDGGVEPTCEYVSHPEGCNGAGIKNATKVPGNLIIMKGEEILYSSGPYKKDESGMTVKIRGNTSAYPTKKPYKIKLEKKKDLLHRGDESRYKDKEWLLLKYDDLKSMAGFFVNQYLGIQWTPAYEFVNVVINGNYRGLYMLTEAVKRNDSCRLNVAKDGYVIEYDAYWWNEEVSFTGGWNYSMQYTFKYPESDEVTKEQKDYIRSYIVKVENSVRDGTYDKYIDVLSFARWLLGHDVLGSLDCAGSNYYLTKYDASSSSKLMMANMWDFDGIYQMKDTWANAHIWGANYYPTLLSSPNRAFRDAYVAMWQSHSDICKKASTYMKSFINSPAGHALDASIVLDNKRWHHGHPNVETSVATSREWFDSRGGWLSGAFAGM